MELLKESVMQKTRDRHIVILNSLSQDDHGNLYAAVSKEVVMKKLRDKNVVVLSVQPQDDYEKLHIKGSENLPLGQSHQDFAQMVDHKYGKDNLYITYSTDCTCNASFNAADALRKEGFIAFAYLGGIQEWSQVGFPTEGVVSQQ